MAIEFNAALVRPEGTGTWTFVPVPTEVSRRIGRRGRIAVRGSVNTEPIVGSFQPDGAGGHVMVVNRSIRDALGVAAGDEVQIRVEVDESERRVTVPDELETLLVRDQHSRSAFEALSFSHQKEFTDWISDGKKPETRERRADKALEMIRNGTRRK